MSTVFVKDGDIEVALRRFKTKNAREGLLKKYREKEEGYKKPGVVRREKREAGKKNSRKRERRYN